MTVRDFCARTGQSVEKLVTFCFSERKAAAAARKPPVARSASKTAGVDTRSRVGREKFDRELVQLLRGVRSGMAARDIAEETGATLVQIRSAVARLVAKSKVRFDGKTAARRYWACG
jgi:DNA-binding NarL/FixJ family response regulator